MRVAITALAIWALGAVAAMAADQPVFGKKLKDGTGVLFVAADPAIVPPMAGGPDDPTLSGDWTYQTFAGATGWVYGLGPSRWIVTGDGTRYKYVDKFASASVRLVAIKPGRLKVKVQVGSVPHGLGEPVAVVLGGGSLRWCAVFEADTWVVAEGGRFVAKDAPAPAACPTFGATTSSSTTFTTSTTSTSVTSTTLLVQCAGGDPFPLCGGTCPAGSVCAPDFDSFALCKCISDTAPCGETYPVCGGTCGDGGTCRGTGVVPFGSCTCEPPGTLCTDGPYPTCGGACGAGTSCFPTIFSFFGTPIEQCQCGSAAPCGGGGLACPPGFSCANAGGTQVCAPS